MPEQREYDQEYHCQYCGKDLTDAFYYFGSDAIRFHNSTHTKDNIATLVFALKGLLEALNDDNLNIEKLDERRDIANKELKKYSV